MTWTIVASVYQMCLDAQVYASTTFSCNAFHCLYNWFWYTISFHLHEKRWLHGPYRHSYHTNLNNIHKSFWGLQVIHFWSLTLHLWHNWTYHFEVYTQCNPFLSFFSLSPTILLNKIFAEHAAVKKSQVNGHTLTTSRDFHALEGDIVTRSLSPLMEITMNIHRAGVGTFPFYCILSSWEMQFVLLSWCAKSSRRIKGIVFVGNFQNYS